MVFIATARPRVEGSLLLALYFVDRYRPYKVIGVTKPINYPYWRMQPLNNAVGAQYQEGCTSPTVPEPSRKEGAFIFKRTFFANKSCKSREGSH